MYKIIKFNIKILINSVHCFWLINININIENWKYLLKGKKKLETNIG